MKNPNQNLPEERKHKVRNFAQELNLMEDNICWKTTFDEIQTLRGE